MASRSTTKALIEPDRGSLARTPRARGAVVAETELDHGPSSSDRVVDSILRGILSGRHVPGQKLIEADLTQQLNVSRGPVREALKRLDAKGVITLTRHRGAYIRAFTRREVDDLLIVMEALTGVMARLAAGGVAHGADRSIMRDALTQLASFATPTSPDIAFIEQRRHFYDTLIELGGNTQLANVIPVMSIHLLRLQVQPFFTAEDRRDRLEEYARVTEAVLAGDAAAAVRAMTRHMRAMRRRLARLPDDAFQHG